MPRNNPDEMLEEWLEGLPDKMCLPYNFEVMVPSECAERCPEAYGKIRNAMMDIFGGTTSWDAVGTWLDDEGKPVIEPIRVITSAHGCTTKEDASRLVREIREAARMSGQEAVSIKAGKFYIIPPEHMLTPEEIEEK